MKKFWMTILGWFIRTLIVAAGTVATGFALYGVFFAIEFVSQKMITFLYGSWQLVCTNVIISVVIATLVSIVWCLADYLKPKFTGWWAARKGKKK